MTKEIELNDEVTAYCNDYSVAIREHPDTQGAFVHEIRVSYDELLTILREAGYYSDDELQEVSHDGD